MKHFDEVGLPPAAVEAQLDAFKALDADWRNGRVPLYVFGGSNAAFDAGRRAYMQYFSENALGAARAFGSIRRLEDEVVAMGLELLHAPAGAVGNMTSGGSESIFMAVRAARERSRASGREAGSRANIVLPETAHPAFAKAASVMSIEERRIPVADDLRADPAAMASAIDADTIMIAGSAPCFPYGVIDPIYELGDLALRRNVWLHVDACIGGYLAPFVAELGHRIPAFDLGVPGVCSLSADLHKFGFCPKPASTIFYHDAALAAFQGFDLDVWPSGRFVTSTLLGTRPGGAVAGAWATMKVLGRAGYREIARDLLAARDDFLQDLSARAGYEPLIRPHLTVMAFTRRDVDVLRVADHMQSRGWVPGLVRKPPAFHLMMSMLHVPALRPFVDDLVAATRKACQDTSSPISSTVSY